MVQWRIEEPRSLDLTGVRRLNVRLVAGSVDVVGSGASADEGSGEGSDHGGDTVGDHGGDPGRAHVEVSALQGPLLVSLEGDTLTITHERLTRGGLLSFGGLLSWVDGRRGSAVVSVAVPESCPVELGVVSADAVVSGITAATKVKSVSGDVTLDGVRADVSAQTISGDLESRGLVGALHFTTVSGDLTVVDGSSGRVCAETVSGQVTLDLDVPADGRIELTSISGDLTLRLTESAGLQVEVKTISGALDSAFGDVTAERKPGRSTLRSRVGTGSGELRAKTVSGDVTLLRRASQGMA